jgi:hypothetical protein
MCELTERHVRGMDMAWARHAMCELMKGMGTAWVWHAMCELTHWNTIFLRKK